MTGSALDRVVTPFDEVYRNHADDVYRFCMSQLRDPHLAEDVTADVFASACAAYDRVKPEPVGTRAWLFRIARNAVIDQHRRAAGRRSLIARLRGVRSADLSVEGSAELRDDLRRVCTALATLSARDRQLVGLRIAGGLSFADVGAVVGMREGAARMATMRALEALRARMGEHA